MSQIVLLLLYKMFAASAKEGLKTDSGIIVKLSVEELILDFFRICQPDLQSGHYFYP